MNIDDKVQIMDSKSQSQEEEQIDNLEDVQKENNNLNLPIYSIPMDPNAVQSIESTQLPQKEIYSKTSDTDSNLSNIEFRPDS